MLPDNEPRKFPSKLISSNLMNVFKMSFINPFQIVNWLSLFLNQLWQWKLHRCHGAELFSNSLYDFRRFSLHSKIVRKTFHFRNGRKVHLVLKYQNGKVLWLGKCIFPISIKIFANFLLTLVQYCKSIKLEGKLEQPVIAGDWLHKSFKYRQKSKG